MKNIFLLAAVLVFAACGATTGAQQAPAIDAQQVMQKSAEIRQQVQDAKAAAAAAQTADKAGDAAQSVGDTIKDSAKEFVQPVVDEYNAWKEAVK